ncbi:alpha-L-fucosidase [Reichenbachiella versicolor]|uniref:alpha-L-fucosidase n=1 Tax=Reichenbachiella versicolor TaxID=1821036 RepID=UPI000D6E7E03|nr:alpha-L-fucosidase [Reichenbachiella versicolor]
MKSLYTLLTFTTLLVFSCQESKESIEKQITSTIKYEPNWESLAHHDNTPEWFQDAKLGIYFHWGVYTVPAFGSEWYPYHMYREGSDMWDYHQKTYGDQSEFGYHHFIPDFKAENFDAKEWVELFKKSGAKFAGPVAQHHDGFAMWDSKVNPWNAKAMGPKRDITGELAKEIRANDMKLITTFHHARNLQRYKGEKPGFASHFIYNKEWHTSSKDPDLKKFYGNVDPKWFEQYWYDQIDEVVKNYDPDIIWFDSWLNFMPGHLRQKMVANFFNNELENNQEVVIAYKQNDLPSDVGVLDIEQGGRRDVSEQTWMTDITISMESWCYVEGQTYKPTSMVVRNLIDVVSKNGVVLLNLSPKSDGTIPEEQKSVLLEMGQWFEKHGEAVFDTRPWIMFGFGNAQAGQGSHGGQSATVEYSASDIRFTQSKDGRTLYMFFLGVPAEGWSDNFRLMADQRYFPEGTIKKVSLMNTGEELDYELDGWGFRVKQPATTSMDSLANVVKIEFE